MGMIKNPDIWGKISTHHSIGNCIPVRPEVGVNVGEEPAERSALEPGSQGFSLRDIPNV